MKAFVIYPVGLLLLIVCIQCNDARKPRQFDKQEWRNGDRLTRGDMADDLVKRGILDRKNKPEVIELLGNPTDSTKLWYSYTVDYGYSTPFYLEVTFDSTEHLVERVTILD